MQWVRGEHLHAPRRKHHHCRAERFRFGEVLPIHKDHALHLATLHWAGRDLTENSLKILTERTYYFTATEERKFVRDATEINCATLLLITALCSHRGNRQGETTSSVGAKRVRFAEVLFQTSFPS